MIRRVYLAVMIWAVSAPAQWLDHPTPGMPRSADGKPNLAARAPKTADGKPDLTGLWQRMQGHVVCLMESQTRCSFESP